jgi:hypothetical protein
MLGSLQHKQLLVVLKHFSGDLASLSRLSLVSRAVHRVLLPFLYAKVVLHDMQRITLFCRTMHSAPQSKCNELVKSLWIEPYVHPSYTLKELISVIEQIHSMLKALTNLEELTFIPTNYLFADVFLALNPEFLLTHFRSICYPGAHFAAFLRSQTSITHLTLDKFVAKGFPFRTQPVNHYYENLASQQNFLPQLVSIEADSTVLGAFCVGRPIKNIILNEFKKQKPEHPDLALSIASSAVPVRSITLTVTVQDLEQGVESQLLASLKSTPVASSLQELSVILALVSAGKLWAVRVVNLRCKTGANLEFLMCSLVVCTSFLLSTPLLLSLVVNTHAQRF